MYVIHMNGLRHCSRISENENENRSTDLHSKSSGIRKCKIIPRLPAETVIRQRKLKKE